MAQTLQRFAGTAVERLLRRPGVVERALGVALSEPKPGTWFDRAAAGPSGLAPVVLDRRSRMLYDDRHVYLNGEAFRAAGRDARIVRRLADRRRLSSLDVQALGADARALLGQWLEAGWLRHGSEPPSGEE
jgi:50S ribosomal protein L16 3-hydroxylase